MKRIIIDFTDEAWSKTTIAGLVGGLARTDGLTVGFSNIGLESADCAFIVKTSNEIKEIADESARQKKAA